jgi:hypothetical protein
MDNPFSVTTPESLTPELVAKLFIVEAMSDYPQLKVVSHTFIHGSRGTGKSMMLRYLEPRVQLAAGKVAKLSELDHLAFHIPLRSANLTVPEFERLAGSQFVTFAEHILCMRVAHKIILGLADLSISFNLDEYSAEIQKLYSRTFLNLLSGIGWLQEPENPPELSSDIFYLMAQICEKEILSALRYLKLLSFNKDLPVFQGTLAGYLDFLVPLAESIQSLSFTPNAPIFVMLDDADILDENMQRILNSWVSCRTTKYLCLKISTQYRYKTYRTVSGQLIESPHDYNEINVNTIYTSNINHYYQRVEAIVKRRLEVANIQCNPVDFFPQNQEQEEKIKQIGIALRQKHDDGEGRGYRASDDSTRYARPEYMRELAGKSKNSATYSYAGFKSIVNISSGIIRQFLEPASLMWSVVVAQNEQSKPVISIPHTIQNTVIAQWSEEFILSNFDKLKVSESNQVERIDHAGQVSEHLRTFLNSLGKAFRTRILDEHASERRLISIMVSDQLSPLVESVLKLGVEWNYLQISTVTTKEGIGRKRQYILSRRLAPYFKIDPSGYAGYLQVGANDLEIACTDSEQFIRQRIVKGVPVPDHRMESLFPIEEDE